jgi:hypothetical protein
MVSIPCHSMPGVIYCRFPGAAADDFVTPGA